MFQRMKNKTTSGTLVPENVDPEYRINNDYRKIFADHPVESDVLVSNTDTKTLYILLDDDGHPIDFLVDDYNE